MKKLLILAVLVVAVLALTACGSEEPGDDGRRRVEQDGDENGDDDENGYIGIVPPIGEINVPPNGDGDDPEDSDANGDDPDPVDEPGNGDEPDVPGNGDDTDPDDAPDDADEPDPADPEPTPAPGPVIPTRPSAVVWSLSTDYDIQNLEPGTSGASENVLVSPYLVGAGPIFFSIVEGGSAGGHAIRLAERAEYWNGVDINLFSLNLNTNANSYQLTVRGHLAGAGNAQIQLPAEPWTIFASESANNRNFTLQFTITAATLETTGQLRINASSNHNITLHEVEIRRVDLVAAPDAAGVPSLPAGMVYTLRSDVAFQTMPVGNVLTGHSGLVAHGNALLHVVANPVFGGNAIRVSNRAADWHTIDLHFAGLNMNPSVNSYNVRITGRVVNPPAEGGTLCIMGTGGEWGRFNRYDPDGDTFGPPIVGAAFDITAVIDAAGMAANAGPAAADQGRIRFAVGQAAETNVFYVYSIEISRR